MIPVSSNYNLQGMSTLNFNNIITNPNQTTLPISALGNILQLHCNPSLTLQVNGTSPIIPVSTKESSTQDQLNTQINTLRNIFPSQQSYQNISQPEQCTNPSPRSFNQLIQELLSTYQDQQENLSQLTIKYNFLLNAMERLLFDVQNNVEYSLLALGISQTINKVKLNQINQLNQLNCASLISNGVIPMINQSHLFTNGTQLSSTPSDTTPISSVIDLTNQRTKPDSTTVMNASSMNKKIDSNKLDFNSSNYKKMTSLDKLDKLIDETVKKSTNRVSISDDNCHSPTSKSQLVNETVQAPVNAINYNMGNAIQQIIRQFYQNASLNTENVGNNGTTTTESNFPNLPLISSRSHLEHIKTSMNNFTQQVTEIIGNTAIPFNNLANRTNHSFILCNNLATNSILNTRREPLVVSMSTTPKDPNPSNNNDTINDTNNITDEVESNGVHEDEDIDPAELDPTEVATRIRDILSLHSIGQRLFAKHVLNLSQGTVSELLSKPKPWSKLSEKGRDSYRKMNQWAQDSTRVQELKSIAPRKGFSGHYAGMSPATPIKEDHETQEKIKRILNDAKMAMASTNNNNNNQQSNVEEELYTYSKPTDSNHNNQPNECTQISFMAGNPTATASNEITSNVLEFDISQLQKKIAALQSTVISGSVVTDSLPQISASLNCQQSPLILMNFSNIVPSSLVMNSNSSSLVSIAPSIHTSKSIQDNNEIKNEPITTHGYNSDNSDIEVAKSNNDIIENDDKINSTINLEMHPISDHLESKNVHSVNFKASIEQENFEKLLKSFLNPAKFADDSLQNDEINTTALVNLIKEHLTKNSISQRTFGCLLGLSQGSISDILSRPKQWSLLTNKGREPYIRMFKYLFKPNNFKVTDNGSNKIENSKPDFQIFSNHSPPNSSSSPMSGAGSREFERSKNFSSDTNNHEINVLSNAENTMAYQDNESYTGSRSCSTEGREYESYDEDIINLDGDLCGTEITNFDQLDLEEWKFDDSKERIFNLTRRIVNLDTISISNAVREILITNNLGQKLFGECILNLSQGSVSELLSKPKAWNQLSFKGKEPYVRMQLWLRQPDKLNILLNNQNSYKYKHNCNQHENQSKKSAISPKLENEIDYEILMNNNCETQHINPKNSSQTNKFNYKKGRIVFTESQKAELLSIYEICPYPRTEHLEEISKKLNIPLKTINNWFHNYRMRNKTGRCLTINCANEHGNYLDNSGNRIESLSIESDINSEKSFPMNKDELCLNDQYSYDGSESESSMPAPHLYPESTQLECVSMENNLNDSNFVEDEIGFGGSNNSINLSVQNIAGSNKRKRANPIKLEMVVSKISNKDPDSHYSRSGDREGQENISTINSYCSKVQKLE